MNAEINTRIIDSFQYLTDSLQVTLNVDIEVERQKKEKHLGMDGILNLQTSQFTNQQIPMPMPMPMPMQSQEVSDHFLTTKQC